MFGQSALEFLTTYSWAVLIIVLFLGSVAIYSITSRAPSNYVQSSCYISPAMPCKQSAITYNSMSKLLSFRMLFTNSLGSIVFFPTDAINITLNNVGLFGQQSVFGNCTPAISVPGTQVSCMVAIPGTNVVLGQQATVFFTLSYNTPCANTVVSSCLGVTYTSGGSALQTAAAQIAPIYTLTLNTNTLLGYIVIDGQDYANAVNVMYQSGNYEINVVPPSGYVFNTWNVVGSGSSLSSKSTGNTVLTLNSNAVLTANFVS